MQFSNAMFNFLIRVVVFRRGRLLLNLIALTGLALGAEEWASASLFETNKTSRKKNVASLPRARRHRAAIPRDEIIDNARQFILFDFETDVLHDTRWLSGLKSGAVAPVIRPKGDSGSNKLSLAPGEGVDGSTALLVESTNATMGLPSFFVAKYRSTGGSYDNIYDDHGYMLPRGVRANRLEFSCRFEKGFRARSAATSNKVDNLHVGTYHFDPAKQGKVVESDNWHFYHQFVVRHDQARDGWIKVTLNTTPQHQRSLRAPPPVNPTQPAGDYWELLTRFYIEAVPYFDDPEIKYPIKMWVDDIKLTYVPKPQDVQVAIQGYATGQAVRIAAGKPQDVEFILSNRTKKPISGRLSIRAPYWLNPRVFHPATRRPVSPLVTLKPGRPVTLVLRTTPKKDLKPERTDHLGLAFVPQDPLVQRSHASLSNRNLEQRRFPDSGTLDATLYGAFIKVTIGTPLSNHPPLVRGGMKWTTRRAKPLRGKLSGFDSEGDRIRYRIVDHGKGGELRLDPNTGDFIFRPSAGFTGIWRFRYQAADGNALSNIAAGWIHVQDSRRSR